MSPAPSVRRRRSIRRLRGLAVALAGVLVLAVTAGVMAVDGRNDAVGASLAADVRALQAEALAENRWDRALLYAVQAHQLEPSPATEVTLLQTVMRAPEAVAVLGTDQPLVSVAVSGDGRRVVAGGFNGSVFVWDYDGSIWNAREVEDVVAFFPEALDISPDGRYVATVQVPVPVYEEGRLDWYVTLVDLEAEPPVVRYLDHDTATNARFAPDGRSIVAVDSGSATAAVVDVETGEVLSTTDLGVDDAWDVVLQQSPDRRLLVASFLGEQSTVVALEAETGRKVWRSVEAGEVAGAVDSDGARAALSQADGRVEVVDLATGERAELEGPVEDGVGSLQWSPDGSTVLGITSDRTVLIWDAGTGALRSRLVGHWGDLSGAVFAPDGTTVYAAGSDRAVLAWDLTGRSGVVRDVPTGEGAATTTFMSVTATMTPDGRIAATALEDNVVRVVDTTRGQDFEVSVPGTAAIDWVSVDRDGRYILVHGAAPLDDPDGGLAITIRVLDVQDRQLLPTAVALQAALSYDAVTTADNASILTAEDDVLRRWDLATGESLDDDLFRAGGTVGGMVVSPEGRLAALDNGEIVDITAGELVADLDIDRFDEPLGLGAMAFSADGRWFAGSLASGRVAVWDARSWTAAPRLWDAVPGLGVDSLVFTPDSDSLVAVAAGRVAMRSLADESGSAVSFAASSTRPDARLRIGTPDGGTMITLDEAGTIREWTTEPGRLIEHACTVAGRNLTPDEWRAVLPDRSYERTCAGYPSG